MIQKALWSCRHCGEEFITQYNDAEISEDFEIEELCYDDFREHVTDCLGITESDIKIIKRRCK
jgi:hypothetical protein